MHCPSCGQRAPKDDKTVCPHCGFDLSSSWNTHAQHRFSSKDREEDIERINKKLVIDRSNEKKYHCKVRYFALLGATLFLLGILVSFAFAYSIVLLQDLFFLFWVGMVSLVLGMAILVTCLVSYFLSSTKASATRIKKDNVMTVGDAMRLHVYYPSWMRDWTFGWIPLIPFGAFLVLLTARIIPVSLFWFLVIAYTASGLLYQYLYSRWWLAKYQKKEAL